MPSTARSPRPKLPRGKVFIAVAVIVAVIVITFTPSLIGALELLVMQQDSNKSLTTMTSQSDIVGGAAYGLAAKKTEAALPDARDMLKGKQRIVTLGDSITKFGGEPEGYVWLLQRYIDALYPAQKSKIFNAGISGNKSTNMQARFQRDVLSKKPDLLTINVGINDVWHAFYDFKANKTFPNGNLPGGVPLSVYREKLTQMVRTAQSAGISVVLLSPTLIYENLDGPENRRLIEYSEAMREIASQNNCLFIDLNTPFREVISTYQKHAGRMQNLLTRDGVHLNAIGNRIMAYTIVRGLGVPENEIQNLRIENSLSGVVNYFRSAGWLRL